MAENFSEKFEKNKKETPREKAKVNSKKEIRKAEEEVAESLTVADIGIREDLVYQAQVGSGKPVEAETISELNAYNPSLVDVIEGVSDYFQIPNGLLYATFYAESRFQHGATGDPTKPGKSIGIGQFREDTWTAITSKKEYLTFIDSVYPGAIFDRGENILADIVATAVYIKEIAKKGKIDMSKDLKPGEIIYIRAKYRGSPNAKILKKLFGEYNKDLKKPENKDYMYEFFKKKIDKEHEEGDFEKYYKNYLDFYYKYLDYNF